MGEDVFWREAQELLQSKWLRSGEAQRQAKELLRPMSDWLSEHLGYRVLFIERPTKKHWRLIEKADELRGKYPIRTPEQVVSEVRDLAGGRFLVLTLTDVKLVLRSLLQFEKETQGITLVGPPRDFSSTPRPGGFRGITQALDMLLSDGTSYPYELQIMTFLQHEWDQVQHRFYEIDRMPLLHPNRVELAGRFEQLSEELHRAQQVIDQLAMDLSLRR